MKTIALLFSLITITPALAQDYPHCAFYPELCISIEGPEKPEEDSDIKACIMQGGYCDPTDVCCFNLHCKPSGSPYIKGNLCLP